MDNNLTCKYCGSIRHNYNSLINHERCCPLNVNRKYKNGMTGKKGSNQYLKAVELGFPKPPGPRGCIGSFTGRTHTEEVKRRISEKKSIKNTGGRCKWYDVSGVKVQGTWERNIAILLNDNNIKWIKPTTSDHSFKYVLDDKVRTYTPDFYLDDYSIYLEIKGFWWGNDRNKMDAVLEQNNSVKIIIIEKDEYNNILKSGDLNFLC